MVIDTDPEWLNASFEYLSEVLETANGRGKQISMDNESAPQTP
jgi:hypothetical protein